MQDLKFKFSKARFKVSGSNRLMMLWRFLSYGLLSLLIGMSLAGCAASSPRSNDCPKPTPIGNVIDVSAWRSDIKKLSTELTELLNSVQKTTSKEKSE